MTPMHNPPHPGAVLEEYLGDRTVTETAARLGVTRVTLSRIVSGASGVSVDMAYRLGDAFGTSPERGQSARNEPASWRDSGGAKASVKQFLHYPDEIVHHLGARLMCGQHHGKLTWHGGQEGTIDN